MAATSTRPRPVLYTALALAAVYVCLPLYFFLFPYSPAASDVPGTATATTPATTSSPPALYFLSLLNRVSLATPFFLWNSLLYAAHILVYPVRVAAPPVLTILHPLILSTKLVLDAFVFAPYRLLSRLAEALYPVYVFCGVACVLGGVIGVGGRWLSALVLSVVLGGSATKTVTHQTQINPVSRKKLS